MTPKALANQMVANGAVYAVTNQYPLSVHLVLAGVYWYERPKRLRWVSAFPEHQSHVHEVPYDTLTEEATGLGVAIRQAGVMVGYICPIREATHLDFREATKTWEDWKLKMDNPHNVKQLAEFVEDAI